MASVDLLPAAYSLARDLHAGQVDKQDRDYVRFHLLPVAYAVKPFGASAVVAGLLHDAVEDTDATLDSLREALPGDPAVVAEIISAIDAVTRRVEPVKETYVDLIGRACADRLGSLVKLADNSLNLHSNDALARLDPDKAASMRHQRYEPARARLIAALDRRHALMPGQIVADGMMRRIGYYMADADAPTGLWFRFEQTLLPPA